MTGRRGRELEHWMTAAAASGEPSLQSFVTGLRVGQDAVTAGPTLQRSPGSVQGHVNRIKTLNRQIYGRASSLVIRSAVAGGHA
jgi:transposase